MILKLLISLPRLIGYGGSQNILLYSLLGGNAWALQYASLVHCSVIGGLHRIKLSNLTLVILIPSCQMPLIKIGPVSHNFYLAGKVTDNEPLNSRIPPLYLQS